ncbi:Rho termination factor N-terminal domain-containing protein [uncultured Clostridium sp.]
MKKKEALNFEKYTLTQLKELAKNNKITGCSTLSKEELLEKLRAIL